MKKLKYIICFVLVLLVQNTATSQRICDETKEHINLSDGVSVDVFKERGTDCYYYVANNLQVSFKNDVPEISFQEYKNNETAAPSGAILHGLFTWGLTNAQLNKLRLLVKQKYGDSAIVSGAVTMDPKSQDITFSNTTIGNILKNALKSRGSLPTFSNSKIALSFHIKQNEVVTIREAIKRPTKFNGTNVMLHYKYNSYTCNSAISSIQKNEIQVVSQLQKWF